MLLAVMVRRAAVRALVRSFMVKKKKKLDTDGVRVFQVTAFQKRNDAGTANCLA